MGKISIVLSGTKYKEYSLNYSISILRSVFKECEVIVSTNDRVLINDLKYSDIDQLVINDDIGELPSLKFPLSEKNEVNNNINKQILSSKKGIEAATNSIVLKIRTDQVILDNSILKLWNNIKKIPHYNNKKGRIITSSIFSINPRYSERMPYHISDMLQLGYKEDLISYFSAPAYPFEYATWYERNPHHPSSNEYERSFRSRFAVEQWLAMHYMFDGEENFPISYHNEWDKDIIEHFENLLSEFFIIAHPDDIHLRASKFSNYESYYNTQCYSTKESIMLLAKAHPEAEELVDLYSHKGMNKKYFTKLMPIIYSPIAQFIIKRLTTENKIKIKNLLNKMTK